MLAKIRKGDHSQFLYSHFNSDDAHRSVPVECRMRLQIIERVRTDDLVGMDDNTIRKRRMEREMYWMSVLMTVFPLGLNDKVEGFGIRGNACSGMIAGFNMYEVVNFCGGYRKKRRRNRHRKKARGGFDDDSLREFADCLLALSCDCTVRLENYILRKSGKFLDRFVKSAYFCNMRRDLRFLVLSCTGFHRRMLPCKKELPELVCNVPFSHKILSDVNVPSIVNSSYVKNWLPPNIRNNFSIRFVFKYGKTIGGKNFEL